MMKIIQWNVADNKWGDKGWEEYFSISGAKKV